MLRNMSFIQKLFSASGGCVGHVSRKNPRSAHVDNSLLVVRVMPHMRTPHARRINKELSRSGGLTRIGFTPLSLCADWRYGKHLVWSLVECRTPVLRIRRRQHQQARWFPYLLRRTYWCHSATCVPHEAAPNLQSFDVHSCVSRDATIDVRGAEADILPCNGRKTVSPS
ncbi:hypothetical protein OH77DRAFT_346067 [Trametes cingulata]|nr:hypothetical protein OH77DRAFT_346067 [Trametes cingulata]